MRPRQLSITEIETLMRSPYDIYAKHVLRLRQLRAARRQRRMRASAASMIHEVFDRFVSDGSRLRRPDAQRDADGAWRETAFAGLDAIGERRDIWLKRFERAAEQFLDYERGRDRRGRRRHAEIEGQWAFPALDGFTLVGKADRIDRLRDGTLEIIDFKTGGVPTPAT